MDTGVILTGVIRQLHNQADDAAADAELLARYACRRDEAAFAAVVRRYGGLVLGVARRQLPDRDAADDVFQATFLALARSADRLERRGPLANWLYTVALRQSRKARVCAARRTERESTHVPPAVSSDPLAEISGRELVQIVDEELARLPERYRLPVLLCCVQGLSREEAATQLGWPDGRVKGRLERGRQRLAARLARRGLAPAAAAFAPLAAVAVPQDLYARAAMLASSPWSEAVLADVAALASESPRRLLPFAIALGSLAVLGAAGLMLAKGGKSPAPAEPLPAPIAEAAKPDNGDPLPAGSVLRFGTSRYRNGTPIESFGISADGTVAVVGSGGHVHGRVRIFDLTTGASRSLEREPGSGRTGESVAISPDGKTVAMQGDTTVHLHEAATGKHLRTIPLPASNPYSMDTGVHISPDGKRLAASSNGTVLSLVEIEKGEIVGKFAHEDVVYAVAFSPDGKRLATGGHDRDKKKDEYWLRIWDADSGRELHRIVHSRTSLRAVAFSPDGKFVAGGGDDAVLRIFDVETGKELRKFPKDGYRIRAVAYSPDGKTVAAAGEALRLYDPATGTEKLKLDRQANAVHFSADGKVLTATVAGTISRWDPATGNPLSPQAAGDSVVDQVLVTADGKRVITRGQHGDAHVWDAKTGELLRHIAATWQRGVALSPDGRFLVWPVADEKVQYKLPEQPNAVHTGTRLRLYNLAAGQFVDRFPGHKSDPSEVTYTPDGKTLIAVDHGGAAVTVWDVEAGKELRSFRIVRDNEKAVFYYVWNATLSPDGKTLAVTYQRSDNTTALLGAYAVRLFDVATGKERYELSGHLYYVTGVAFSPDSRLLVTASPPLSSFFQERTKRPVNQVYVWDVKTGKRVNRLPDGLPVGAVAAALSPDGRTLALAVGDERAITVGDTDGSIKLYETATWTVRATFQGKQGRVTSLTFAPDGRLLAGGLDTTVLAWDVRPAKPAATQPLDAAWLDLTEADAAHAFQAQGRLLADATAAIPFFSGKIKPVERPDAAKLTKLVVDLGNPQFAVREAATKELRTIGGSATAALQAAESSDSAEVRRRASEVLTAIEGATPTPDELRELRAVEVAEWANTPEARRLLGTWAGGAPGARLTEVAKSALGRMRARE